jgi:hypothetical protein
MARRFAGGAFISMAVKINPDKVAPVAIRDEETPMSTAMRNPGDGASAMSSKRWRLVRTVQRPVARREPHQLPYGLVADSTTVLCSSHLDNLSAR